MHVIYTVIIYFKTIIFININNKHQLHDKQNQFRIKDYNVKFKACCDQHLRLLNVDFFNCKIRAQAVSLKSTSFTTRLLFIKSKSTLTTALSRRYINTKSAQSLKLTQASNYYLSLLQYLSHHSILTINCTVQVVVI